MTTVDPNRLILTGENPFIRFSETDDGPLVTEASLWRIILSPAGAGHVLYLKSEVVGDSWRIYADNEPLARWLQQTAQGNINPASGDAAVPVTAAAFRSSGTVQGGWTEHVEAAGETLALTWAELGEPLLIHTRPHQEPGRPYGVCTVLIPAGHATLTRNGTAARGAPRPRDHEGRPFSTCALAFSESWTEERQP
ncbi:MAG: hypothetical protein ACFCVH_02025 [Alphaproteobacteria bacterium]